MTKSKAERRAKTEAVTKRQVKIAEAHGISVRKNEPHRYAKMHSLNCGDPNCFNCGNPRKFFGEKTIQEKIIDQKFKEFGDRND